MTLSDKEIIIKIKNGELDYFEKVVKKYTDVIHRYIRAKLFDKGESEDLVQNTFLSFYKAIQRFDQERPILPYLYQIAKNELKMYYRSHKQTVTLNDDMRIVDESEEVYRDNYDSLLKTVPAEHRRILELLIQGYSYKEIAQSVKRPLNTVKTMIHRIRLQMKNLRYEKN